MPDKRGFRIRASMLGQAAVCPGVMALENEALEKKIETGSAFVGPGNIGHKWLELRVGQGVEAADAYLETTDADNNLRVAIHEFWDWWASSDLVPVLEGDDVYTERQVKWLEAGDRYYGSGTADLIVVQDAHAWVVDYKFYNDPSMLPPIHEDMQMFAYAVGAVEDFPWVSTVTVHRVQGYFRYADSMQLDAESIELAREALAEEASACYDGRDRFKVSARCQGCFHRDRCDTHKALASDVETTEMQPYDGGKFRSEAEVLRFLIAAPVIKERIEAGYAAARKFIESKKGKHITDVASAKVWGPKSSARDVIEDSAGCLGELASMTTTAEALSAAKTSKSAMEGVLKARSVAPKERKAFIGKLRELGYIQKREGDPRYEWRRLGDGTNSKA